MFLRAATVTADRMDITTAQSLLQYLIQNWSRMGWSAPSIHELAQIAFVPCVDASGCDEPPSGTSVPTARQLENLHVACSGRRKAAKGGAKKANRLNGVSNDYEDVAGLDVHECGEGDEFEWNLGYHIKESLRMISSSFDGSGLKNTPVLILRRLCDERVVLHADAWATWASAPILPAAFDHAPEILKALGKVLLSF